MSLVIELLDLIKILQDQLDKKKKLDLKFFTEHVSPVWEIFGKIHEDYLISFGKYIDLLNSGELKVATLIERIERDSIQSSNFRSDLFNHIKTIKSLPQIKARVSLPEGLIASSKQPLSVFIEAIETYFLIPQSLSFSFNKVDDDKWLFLSEAEDSYYSYGSTNKMWELGKSHNEKDKQAYKILSTLIPENDGKVFIAFEYDGELNIYSDNHLKEHIHTVNGKNKQKKNKDDETLMLWGDKIRNLVFRPTNEMRAGLLSAIILKPDMPKKELVAILLGILKILQGRYDVASWHYYEYRIRSLG